MELHEVALERLRLILLAAFPLEPFDVWEALPLLLECLGDLITIALALPSSAAIPRFVV